VIYHGALVMGPKKFGLVALYDCNVGHPDSEYMKRACNKEVTCVCPPISTINSPFKIKIRA
jgi:hypothetical protein